jgi:outer membrane lipoprotein carrier protein
MNHTLLKAGFGMLLLTRLACAAAGGMEALEQFVSGVRFGHAEFTQVVTAPTHASQPARSKSSSGTLDFARPNRFRFDYQKPFVQTIVADGQTLWLYDADLNQVTARKQSAVLNATPAALIASSGSLKALQADFVLREEAAHDGLEWVLATPRDKDGSLQSIRVGLRDQSLAVLDIVDNFGQRSVMRFSSVQTRTSADPALFQFKPPAGADVIRP